MKYIDIGRINIVEQCSEKDKEKIGKPVLKNGSIVYCKGHNTASSFYGIVYENGILELEHGSDAYIKTKEDLHIGDKINYWTIEYACKTKLIVEEMIGEEQINYENI